MSDDNRIKWQRSGYDDDNDELVDYSVLNKNVENKPSYKPRALREHQAQLNSRGHKRLLPLGRVNGEIKSFSIWHDLGEIIDERGEVYFFHESSLEDRFLPQPGELVSFEVRLVRDQVVYAGGIRRINWNSNTELGKETPPCPFCGSTHGVRYQFIPELEDPEINVHGAKAEAVSYAAIDAPEMAEYCQKREQDAPNMLDDPSDEDGVWVCASCLREVPRTSSSLLGARADLRVCNKALAIVHHNAPLMRVVPYGGVMGLLLLLTWGFSTSGIQGWIILLYFGVCLLGLVVFASILRRKTAKVAPVLAGDTPFLYLLSGSGASKSSSVYQERVELLLNNTATDIKILADIKDEHGN